MILTDLLSPNSTRSSRKTNIQKINDEIIISSFPDLFEKSSFSLKLEVQEKEPDFIAKELDISLEKIYSKKNKGLF